MLQSFEDIKLYIPPNYVILNSENQNNPTSLKLPVNQSAEASGGGLKSSSSAAAAADPPLPGQTEILEVNFKDIINQVLENLNPLSLNQWFTLSPQNNNNEGGAHNLFDSILQAVNFVDFNLKRNSDFINELTKLLDTSRAIKQEAHLKKLLKNLEEEKQQQKEQQSQTVLVQAVPTTHGSFSQPSSPSIRPANSENLDPKSRSKSKSFKGFLSTKPKSKENNSTTSATPNSSNFLAPPSPTVELSPATSSSHLAALKPTAFNFTSSDSYSENEIINNSDYIELESEVEKISFNLDKLNSAWSKLASTRTAISNSSTPVDPLKYSIELQSLLLNELNSTDVLNELEKSLFKLNWLITSKSGYSEPNWKTNVLSLTPSTLDSFIGVNLLKIYYRYVKYDFVSYKLFTRQLQLIQLSAIVLNLIHRVLNFYKEAVTLSTINGANFFHNQMATSSISLSNAANQSSGAVNNLESVNQSLLSFTFSADKYKPISWSANHVTLYNVQSHKDENSN